MLIKRTTLSQAIKLACSGLVAGSVAFAGAALAEEAVELEKESVTGSHIKRVDIEGPSPVLVIDREAIDRSGETTVAAVLRNLTANTGPSFDEKFTNSFAPGSAGVSLRGLGQNATLVLVNGRRVANYGFAQNITDAFVDLNSIPLGAVERIEVLKDGASAIYGSDAIAGVINIIMRKDYEGAEVTVGYGETDKSDGDEVTANFLAGVTNGKSNLMFNIDYLKRGAVDIADRKFSESADHTGQVRNDGYDFRSSTFPVANVRAATGEWLKIDNFFDYNPFITMIPETERLGALVNYNLEINNDLKLVTEFSYVQTQTDAQMAPTPLFGDLDDVLVAADNPFNTYGVDVYTRWRMLEAGSRKSHIESDSYRLLGGLEGSFGNWDWNSAVFYSRSKSSDTGTNYVNRVGLIDAIDQGLINPFGTTPNDMSIVKASTNRTAVSTLGGVDANFTTEIWELPAGMVGLALGGEYRDETIDDQPDALSSQGQIIGSGGTSSEGDRQSTSLYAEFNVPIIEDMEMQFALRFEDYSDFGTTTNPKVAVRYQPADWVMLRASWGTGFRAPSLAELYLGESLSYPFLVDTSRCDVTGADQDCGGTQYKTYFTGNPDLDAEESESIYLGVVFEPLEDLTLGVDYWNYEHEDIIDSDTQYVLDHEDSFPGSVVRSAPAFPGDPGEILYINDSFQNIAKQETDGFDFDFKYKYDTGQYGEFGFQWVATYVNSFERSPVPGEPLEELVGTYSRPEWRHNTSLNWGLGDFGATLIANYIGEYEQYYTNWDDKVTNLDSFLTWDGQFVYYGLDSTELTLGVRNMFDEDPPFSNSETEGYDFSIADPRGRFIYARANYKF